MTSEQLAHGRCNKIPILGPNWGPVHDFTCSRTAPPIALRHAHLTPSRLYSLQLIKIRRRYQPIAYLFIQITSISPSKKRQSSIYMRLYNYICKVGTLYIIRSLQNVQAIMINNPETIGSRKPHVIRHMHACVLFGEMVRAHKMVRRIVDVRAHLQTVT